MRLETGEKCLNYNIERDRWTAENSLVHPGLQNIGKTFRGYAPFGLNGSIKAKYKTLI